MGWLKPPTSYVSSLDGICSTFFFFIHRMQMRCFLFDTGDHVFGKCGCCHQSLASTAIKDEFVWGVDMDGYGLPWSPMKSQKSSLILWNFRFDHFGVSGNVWWPVINVDGTTDSWYFRDDMMWVWWNTVSIIQGQTIQLYGGLVWFAHNNVEFGLVMQWPWYRGGFHRYQGAITGNHPILEILMAQAFNIKSKQ